jgi:23S rRNA (cytidine1920-2'-O)/16S rRNA (cytidine1409-2'-O)-methyltransferase
MDVDQAVAADLGANVGGFTDCLLQAGAERVYAVETGYGVLDWRLRKDPRVVVLERTNALHVVLPEPIDIVAVDVGWTPMRLIAPVAIGLLTSEGRCLALLKPQYEAKSSDLREGHVVPGAVERIEGDVIEEMKMAGVRVLGSHVPQLDRKGRNPELFLLLGKG